MVSSPEIISVAFKISNFSIALIIVLLCLSNRRIFSNNKFADNSSAKIVMLKPC